MDIKTAKKALSHVGDVSPKLAREVLKQGSWANGEMIAENEREALEFIAAIEE